MAEALAAFWMATKIHATQLKYPILKRQDRATAEIIYRNNIDKIGETEKYEKSRMPESGYMTTEEYEQKSRAKSIKDINDIDLKEVEIPKDENMVYVPQKKFKLVKYNDPVGSPELTLPRKLNFDRQINAQGIISGDYKMLIYPTVYYYADNDCTSCDLFQINLNPNLSNIEKIKHANIVNKEREPLISTSKDNNTKFIFRTLTPIDFSNDNKKLIVKEKIGHRHDGIWETDLWVYDFEKKEAKKLPQIREAIVNYWIMAGGIDFDEKRWDIYPMGFHANDESRIVICAYAYTGEIPKFLGTWSIDTNGENTKLEDIKGYSIPISTVGYRLEETEETIPITEIEFETKLQKEKLKQKEKEKISLEKFENKLKKLEYQRKIEQMDMETYIKIKERQNTLKNYKN